MNLLTREASEVVATGPPPERLTALLDQLGATGFEPSLVVLPINFRLTRSLDVSVAPDDVSGSGLGRNRKSPFDGVLTIDWWEVPRNRMYAVDLGRFCAVEEGLDDDGVPAPPDIKVDAVDEQSANEIVADWETSDEGDVEAKVKRVLTNVIVRILRPYRVDLLDPMAAMFVELDSSELE